jgi:hypothetical protein
MSNPTPSTIFREHPDPGYPARTEWNAANSDVTIDFVELRGGLIVGSGGNSGLTRLMAQRHQRSYVGVPIAPDHFDATGAAQTILAGLPTSSTDLRVNIAGHGLSGMAGIGRGTINAYLTETLAIVVTALTRRNQGVAFRVEEIRRQSRLLDTERYPLIFSGWKSFCCSNLRRARRIEQHR